MVGRKTWRMKSLKIDKAIAYYMAEYESYREWHDEIDD